LAVFLFATGRGADRRTRKMYSVYFHRNKINGRIYVGSTSLNPKNRWRRDGRGYIKQRNFYSEIEKYGWENFEHIIVAKNLTKEEALKLEEEIIRKFNSANSKYDYNMSHTGQGTLSPNEELREAISGPNNYFYGKSKKGSANPMYGKNLSEEHKQKLCSYRTGTRLSEEVRQKISIANSGTNNAMWGRNQTKVSCEKMSLAKLSKRCPGFKGILNINTGMIFSLLQKPLNFLVFRIKVLVDAVLGNVVLLESIQVQVNQ
jgi:group I intron endonuclease